MQITFIFIALVGLILVIYGINILIKELSLKEVVEFDLISQPKLFDLNKIRLYSVSFIGIGTEFRVRNLNISITQPNDKPLEITNNKIKYSFNRKGKRCLQNWSFVPIRKGEHKIEFENLSEFIEKNPTIKSENPIINRRYETNKLKILIKESGSTKDRFLMILSIVIGVNGLIWGILIGIKPDLFG